jgi:hypothetical protein
MKNLKRLPQLLCLVVALACLHVSVTGQTTDDKNRFATISGSGSTVRWEVAAPYSALTLTISAPDGQVFRREFKAGSAPEFTLTDRDGSKLPDGQYNYELRLTPEISADVRKELSAARAKSTDDDAAPVREMRKRGLLPTALSQSGTFQILGGAAVVAGATEDGRQASMKSMVQPLQQQRPVAVPVGNPASKRQFNHMPLTALPMPDQVIPDDLIVQGSLCVGFDCVNNESFGFDTIRLKENSTRIKFEDTSVGSYPTNDWQLTANDSASGGANKFSIEDITGAKVPFTITAGAATNSIFVDSTGRLGLRTSTPVLDIHANTSNTPAIRLEQNNGGGFTAQTWDVAGNEANFFVRDVTGGSKLPFRIRPGALTSSIDINASGEVGIGTATATAQLTVKQSEDSIIGGIHVRRTGVNADTWALAVGTDNNLYFGYATSASGGDAGADYTVQPLILTASNRVGVGTSAPDQKLSVNGDASKIGGGSWLAFSDERLKNIKGNFTSGLSAVMQLQPLRYEYRRDNLLGLKSEGEHIGFGAQALQKIIPEAVTRSESGYLMVNNDPVIWTMLNAIKEQQKEIEHLKAQIRQLQPRAGGSSRTRHRRR